MYGLIMIVVMTTIAWQVAKFDCIGTKELRIQYFFVLKYWRLSKFVGFSYTNITTATFVIPVCKACTHSTIHLCMHTLTQHCVHTLTYLCTFPNA